MLAEQVAAADGPLGAVAESKRYAGDIIMKVAHVYSTCAVAAMFLFSVQFSLGDELAELQGTWEMVQTQNGVEQRVTKTIKDRTETVEVFVNGVLTQKHEVEIAIETFGPVKVFLWKNGQIIGGPNKGKKFPDGKSIFRLEDKTWIAVHGMLQDDNNSVAIEVFRRPPTVPSA